MKLTFEPEATEDVLPAFGATTDEDGYIVNEETGKRVKTPDGETLTAEELGVIEHGSTHFVDDNFGSLVEHVERQRDD